MATKSWYPASHGGDGTSWQDPNNWEDDSTGLAGVPGAGDTANMGAFGNLNGVTITSNANFSVASIVWTGCSGVTWDLQHYFTVSGALTMVSAMAVTGWRGYVSWGSLTDPYGFFTQYTVTATATNGTAGSPYTCYKGETAYVTVTPNTGYVYDTIDGGASWSANTMSVANVTATASYNVTFKLGMIINGVSMIKFCGVTAMKINGM